MTIAAVRGYCPAGGCILSLCCDARVVTEDCRMGLNEVALGIPVPKFWVKIMVNTVGGCEPEALSRCVLRALGA